MVSPDHRQFGSVDRDEFRRRTRMLGLRVIRLVRAMPKTAEADIIARQVIRSSTSVGANYRAACRAKSTADYINKLKIVEEEADETLYWLELIIDADLMSRSRLDDLMRETNELIAMTVASIKTLRKRNGAQRPLRDRKS